MTPQPGTAGTSDDPLEDIQTELLALDGVDIDTLVALCFDSASQPTALRFDGTGSSSGFFDGSAVAVVNGSVKSISGAEYVDPSGTSHTLDSWQRGDGAVPPLAWETASDWDAAVSESGVVHESYGTLPGTGTVQLGVPASDPGGSALEAFYPFDEASGASTFTDIISGYNLDNNGVAAGATGELETNAGDFDGSDFADRSASPGDALKIENEMAVVAVVNQDGQGSLNRILHRRDANNDGTSQPYSYFIDGGDLGWQTSSNNFETVSVNTSVPTNQWVTLGWNLTAGSQFEAFLNGASQGTASVSSDLSPQGDTVTVGSQVGGGQNFDGRIGALLVFSRTLSGAEHSTLHALSSGTLTTATKSFTTSAEPDLQNLQYSLNGETIDLDIIGSPGTASEEVVTQSLGGATSYSLSWSSSHTDFRVRPKLSTSDPTVTPTISKIELGP